MFSRWTSPTAVFEILKCLSKGRPCDFSGIEDYRSLDEAGGIQWPAAARNLAAERRLFEDGQFYHSDGKAKFIFDPPRPMPEGPCEEYPFVLMTGRGSSAQWHTQTRTGKSEVLRRLYPQKIYVEINRDDARELKISANQLVEVCSRRGRIEATAFLTYAVRRGQIFIPMHYAETNQLTFAAFDPYSRQPSYKACAVALRNSRAERSN
jgi:anaerobic selenocysteine-containing dehydrogenase